MFCEVFGSKIAIGLFDFGAVGATKNVCVCIYVCLCLCISSFYLKKKNNKKKRYLLLLLLELESLERLLQSLIQYL